MKKINQKNIAIPVFLILLLSTSAFMTMPTTNAHDPAWEVPTHAYIVVSPNPIGVGQEAFVVFWLDWIPIGAAGIGGDRWTNLKVEITKPDGNKETLGPFTSDSIGTGFAMYTPDQVGNYTFEVSFPGQIASKYNPLNGVEGSNTRAEYIGDKFLPSNATTTLNVQEEQAQRYQDVQLPTEYWTRPIEGQNTNWYKVASNWLGGGIYVHKNVQPFGTAPNTPHIMWTKPYQDAGVVGESITAYPLEGQTYYTGDSYEPRFQDSIVINGRLYYSLALGSTNGLRTTGGGGYMCVDLRTGDEIWYSDALGAEKANTAPIYGQLFLYDSMNQHGVVGSYLWQVDGSTWAAYDALTGKWLFNETNVPSGYTEYGQNGEITRYVLDYNHRWLALWNNTQHNVGLEAEMDTVGGTSSNAYQWRPNGKVVDMSRAVSWNVSIPDLPGSTSPTIEYVIPGELLLGTSSSYNSYMTGTSDPWTMWAISLKPQSRGQLMWLKDFPAPTGNTTIYIQPYLADPVNHVWLAYEENTMLWTGYSMDDGSKLWGPLRVPGTDWDFHSRSAGGYPSHSGVGEAHTIANGKLYLAGFSGLVNCVDMKTGKVLWTYGNGGEGNSTYMGLNGPWGNYPTFIGLIADDKVYTFTSEHSISQPIYKGSQWRCLNASTGEELWTISGYSERNMAVVADGYLVNFNEFDGQIYCMGKGPSALTVTAPDTSVELGRSVVIRGTVTDIAAGTKQNEQAARFPNGLPAVSDDSMSAWMEYVYMQKPYPSDAEGVLVAINVIDSNGNYRNIGETTSDTSGMFTFTWKPDIPGDYIVIANFAGSESYWPSYAETSFVVDEPAPTTVPTPLTTQSATDTYVLAAAAAIIIAVAIGFAITILTLKKRP
jgi:outer membrane protein assembly factor BamB